MARVRRLSAQSAHPHPAAPRRRPARTARRDGPRRTALVRIAATLALVVALGACTPLRQYRSFTDVVDPATGAVAARCVDPVNTPDSDCALERRSYEFGGEPHPYYFAAVEFDDQGWAWDREQQEGLLRFLWNGPEQRSDTEYLIIAYAHGWQHNAGACDNNVVCFQRLLERLDLTERVFVAEHNRQMRERGELDKIRDPRTVVGVYIGWRGLSGSIPRVRATTFWNRTRAGRRVGNGGVGELLVRLNDFRGFKNEFREGSKTQLLVLGHSFGGLVVYKALAQNLIERAVDMERRRDGGYGYTTANSIGDLVVLVNPAFEGAAFEPMQFATTNRCYPPWQRPVLMVVTSEADGATGTAFPLGRRLGSGLTRGRSQPAGIRQKQSVLGAVGHLDRYRTHSLEVVPRAGVAEVKPPQRRQEGPCGCPFLGPTSELTLPQEGMAPSQFRATDMTARDRLFFGWIEQVKAERGRTPEEVRSWCDEDEARRDELRCRATKEDVPSGEPVFELDPALVTRQGGYPTSVSQAADAAAFRTASYGTDFENHEMVLERETGGAGPPLYAANHPYLMVRTTKEFIPDHSTIYGERFIDFVRRFYLRHLASKLNFPEECFGPGDECVPTPITPCERSSRCRVRGEVPAACPPAY